ncbi:MAG TPA: hypothetical protein VG144_04620 [Gaiellaceae bacterium]|nr:hypothetical protein [Gaiellaceae bacterium]
MDERGGWERVAAATGVLFVVLAFIGFLLAPDPPSPGDSNEQILEYFSDKETQLRWQALFFAAAGAALLWFAGTLASLLRRRLDVDRAATGWLGDAGRRWPPIVVASAATAVGIYTAGVAAYTALAARAGEEIDAGAGRALFELGGSLLTYTDFPALVFVGAASLAIANTRLLADWVAWLGAAVAAVLAIDGIGAVVGDSDTFGPSGVIGIIAFLSFLVWVLVTSGLLAWRGTVPARTRAEA